MFGLSTLVTKIIALVVVIGLVIGGYFMWKSHVEKQALVGFNAAQITQTTKDNAVAAKKEAAVTTDEQKIVVDLKQKDATAAQNLEPLKTFLDAPTTIKTDRTSSMILKRTIADLAADAAKGSK